MWGILQGSGPESINIFCPRSYKRILPSMVSGQCTYSFISNGMFELTYQNSKSCEHFTSTRLGFYNTVISYPQAAIISGQRVSNRLVHLKGNCDHSKRGYYDWLRIQGKPSHEHDCQIYKKIMLCQSTLFWGVCHSNFHDKNSQVADSNDRGQ